MFCFTQICSAVARLDSTPAFGDTDVRGMGGGTEGF